MRALVVVVVVAVAACSGPAKPVDKQPAAVVVTAPPADAAAPPDAPIDAAIPRASPTELAAVEKDAWARAKPVFDRYCTKCHARRGRFANAKRLDALDLTKYPPGGRYAKLVGGAVRDVLGQSGLAAKMPFDKPGAVAGDDLALVLAWCDAWEHAHAP